MESLQFDEFRFRLPQSLARLQRLKPLSCAVRATCSTSMLANVSPDKVDARNRQGLIWRRARSKVQSDETHRLPRAQLQTPFGNLT